MGLVDVHVGGVGLCLLCLHGGLESCDGAGNGGQSVSVITKEEGTSCREGMGGGFGSGLVEVEVVRQ